MKQEDIKSFLNKSQEFINNKVEARTYLHIIRNAMAEKTGYSSTGGLKDVTDIAYYQGGYPGENSPPRIDAYCDKLGASLNALNAAGNLDAINHKLASYGVSITVNAPTLITTKDSKKLNNQLEAAYNNFGYNADVADFISCIAECHTDDDYTELMTKYLNLSKEFQQRICENADDVKIELIDELVSKTNIINKSAYIQAAHELYNLRKKLGNNEDQVIEQVNDKMAKVLERENAITELRDELNLKI